MENTGFDVYFDYIYIGGPQHMVLVAAMIYDNEGSLILAESEERRGVGPQNKHNLEHAILAFDFAITKVQQNYLESVVFKNQNNLVFSWILQESNPRKVVTNARNKLITYLTTEGLNAEAQFEEVVGKDNPVKKYFKKKVGVAKAEKSKGSFNDLLKANAPKATKKDVSQKDSSGLDYKVETVITPVNTLKKPNTFYKARRRDTNNNNTTN